MLISAKFVLFGAILLVSLVFVTLVLAVAATGERLVRLIYCAGATA